MRDQRKTEIKVGITVVTALLIFLWILGWAKNLTIASGQKSVMVSFTNVAGLEIGDDVTVSGVRKGFVENFRINKSGVTVKLSIDADTDLKEDAVFALTMLDMMGGKKIDITPGNSESNLDYSTIHPGIFHADIPAVMSMVGNMKDDLVITLGEIKTTLTSLNKMLTDERMNENLRSSLNNLSELSFKLNKMIEANSTEVTSLIKNTNELTLTAKEFIDENKTSLSESVSGLKSVLNNSNMLLDNLNKFADETKEQKNNLGLLLYDRNLVDSLRITIQQVNDVTKILIEQLKGKGINVDAKIDLF
jgi:phospholipid/cholesterol/gamma-HCH transport system substrate-binding protein